MSDVPEGEAPASSETDSELACGTPCLACPPHNKHAAHTCGKARSAKKRCKQSAPPEAVHDDESDDARDKARGKAKAKDKAKDKEKGDSKARPVRRRLTPIPQIGLGHKPDCDSHIGATLPTPWWMRTGNTTGPFGDTACMWMRGQGDGVSMSLSSGARHDSVLCIVS